MSDELKTIVFETLQVDGEPKVFVQGPWPAKTTSTQAQLDGAPAGLVVIDGDSLTLTAANGTASYLKIETEGDGTMVFELLESTFEPAPAAAEEPPPAPVEPPAEPVKEADLVIDSTAEDEPLPARKTFGTVLADETRAAFARGDMTAHAALHNFEISAGDFKRAAQALAGKLPEGSDLRNVLTSIISNL